MQLRVMQPTGNCIVSLYKKDETMQLLKTFGYFFFEWKYVLVHDRFCDRRFVLLSNCSCTHIAGRSLHKSPLNVR